MLNILKIKSYLLYVIIINNILDVILSLFRIYNEPITNNCNKLSDEIDDFHAIFASDNLISTAMTSVNIANCLYQHKFIKLIEQISYISLPVALYYKKTDYTFFKFGAVSASVGFTALEFYQNSNYLYKYYYNDKNLKLKSVIAYKEFYDHFSKTPLQNLYDFKTQAEQLEIEIDKMLGEMSDISNQY
jgi:hypothetical protein